MDIYNYLYLYLYIDLYINLYIDGYTAFALVQKHVSRLRRFHDFSHAYHILEMFRKVFVPDFFFQKMFATGKCFREKIERNSFF